MSAQADSTQDSQGGQGSQTGEVSIVFVCTGNICRSAMAERIAAAELSDLPLHIDSAGISDEEHGNPIDPRAARVLSERGYDTAGHAARQLTADWLASRDIAIVMTERHRQATERLLESVPEANRPEVRMLRSYDPACAGRTGDDLDVFDPWYGDQDGFYETFDMITAALPGIREAVASRR
ncbi:low molecular weight phosphotyrosine protein phosphatase [Brevibacterium luteolum]|uniref:protein-tyrosine-phosphatase n=2 Tax=Brevibacterium luteolum TaxID=199591 RepID=A0A849ASC0_9MICO|nr:low molecular weight phosphotyrosine protein phosphatase [Brevibacterium luteolum]